jgi:two-component system, OmpR family, heavy metal sensor histidine kinase CusS
MKPLPSRLKIALLSAGISGVVLAAFGVAMWLVIYDMRLEAVDREILTLGSRHPGLFAGRGNPERLTSLLESTFGEDYTNRIVLTLRDSSGQMLYTSPHWPAALDSATSQARLNGTQHFETNPPAAIPGPERSGTGRSGTGRGGMGRGYGMGPGGPPQGMAFTRPPRFFSEQTADSAWRFGVLANEEVTLVIGLNQQEIEDELNQVRNAFLLTLPVALFLVGLGGWVVAGRALHPLKTIADTAEHVTASGLDQRIPQRNESPEAARVIQVLNRMMDRLETSFRQATRFSADASHELKTPLAVMQGELENALQAAAPGSPEQHLCSNLLEETQRLKTITRSLLLLAQADAGQLKLSLESVDLSAELEAMLEDARVLASGLRLHFEVAIQPGLRIEADRALLRTALFNLIGNAIKHNETGGRLAIRLQARDNQTVLSVGNSGPGIPPADQSKIFERFYRIRRTDHSRADGIGLGLSLAREIVRAHGGELLLEESRAGWTCFVVSLNSIR